MTAAQTEFMTADAGLAVAGQRPALTAGPSAIDRLLAPSSAG